MVLHNFIREHASDDEDFTNFDRDPNFVPTILERYNKYIVSQHLLMNQLINQAL